MISMIIINNVVAVKDNSNFEMQKELFAQDELIFFVDICSSEL